MGIVIDHMNKQHHERISRKVLHSWRLVASFLHSKSARNIPLLSIDCHAQSIGFTKTTRQTIRLGPDNPF